MNHSDIEHMAQGFPPSSIGKDHEEVVTFLTTSLLAAQQKLNALAVENAAMKSVVEPIANLAQYGEIVSEMADALRPHEIDTFMSIFAKAKAISEVSATEAALNAVRAEGIIMFASKQLSAAGDLESTITLERLMLDAEEFAGQLRASAGKDGE